MGSDGAVAGRVPGFGAPAQKDHDTADVAKDQAAQVSQGAVEAGQHVVDVAKDRVATVADEAGRQAKDLLAQAREELSQQAGQQQLRIAEGLRALGEELQAMTRHDGPSGVATDLAQQGARKSHDVASWLERREPGHVVADVKRFAQQRPGSFLLLAAGLGLAAGRLTRGVKDAGDTPPAAPSQAGLGAAARVSPPLPAVGEYGSSTLDSDAVPARDGS
jgi:hypothetical protein